MMKTLTISFAALLFLMLSITACNKFGDLSGQTGKIIASDTLVKINQPDSLLLVGANPSDSLNWAVSPSGADSLISEKNAALIFFKKAGVYEVTASGGHTMPASISIAVSDSVYHVPAQYKTVSLTGDDIALAPHYSSNPDSSFISFTAQTMNSYCSPASLKWTDSLVNNSYGIAFLNVSEPAVCSLGTVPVTAVIRFSPNGAQTLQNGTFPLSVTLNGTTYNGTIMITAQNISFNWGYTSGVTISPKQINR